MGYHSFINLTIEEGEVTVDEVAETVAEVTKDTDVRFWKSVLNGETEVKWYDHTSDMKQVSVKYPDALLVLSGEGEENDDCWVEYHRNGKVQEERRPEWIAPPFDPEKLA